MPGRVGPRGALYELDFDLSLKNKKKTIKERVALASQSVPFSTAVSRRWESIEVPKVESLSCERLTFGMGIKTHVNLKHQYWSVRRARQRKATADEIHNCKSIKYKNYQVPNDIIVNDERVYDPTRLGSDLCNFGATHY